MSASNIIINGAFGRMGQITATTLEQHPEFNLLAKLGREENLTQAIKTHQPDIIIDFTLSTTGYKNACVYLEQRVHAVIGTSGFSQDQLCDLKNRCAKLNLGMVIAPNFSLGAVLLGQAAAQLSQYYPHAEIIEAHRFEKPDAPSATAIKTAELINQTRQATITRPRTHEILPNARGTLVHNTPIHAIRLPGIIADLEVRFGANGETLTLHHHTTSREAFMPGVILACQKVLDLNELIYGLENLL